MGIGILAARYTVHGTHLYMPTFQAAISFRILRGLSSLEAGGGTQDDRYCSGKRRKLQQSKDLTNSRL